MARLQHSWRATQPRQRSRAGQIEIDCPSLSLRLQSTGRSILERETPTASFNEIASAEGLAATAEKNRDAGWRPKTIDIREAIREQQDWRRQRAAGAFEALSPAKRGPKTAIGGEGRNWSKQCRPHSIRTWVEGQFLAAQRREGQALEARLFVESLFDCEPDALIAICGDLNSEEHDMTVRLLTGIPDEDAENMSRRVLIPLGMRVDEAHRFTVVHAKRPMLIDHILASRPLAVGCKGVTILNEGLQDEVKAEEPILGSLHAPVIASFVLNVTNAGCSVIPDEK